EDVQSYERMVDSQLVQPRFNTLALGMFALFGLLLASMGIYGVVAYAVTRRTREMGIRIALGAQPRALVALVSRRGLGLAMTGGAVGLAGSLALTRVLTSLVHSDDLLLHGRGIVANHIDPLAQVFAAVVLAVVVLVACLLPARRAAAVDPIVALRAE